MTENQIVKKKDHGMEATVIGLCSGYTLNPKPYTQNPDFFFTGGGARVRGWGTWLTGFLGFPASGFRV